MASHQFVSARQYMAAGNGADEFSVRVVYGGPEPGFLLRRMPDGFAQRSDRELPLVFPAPAWGQNRGSVLVWLPVLVS